MVSDARLKCATDVENAADAMALKSVKILWTGGWDSTFRVLELVRAGVEIQPVYIWDPGRPSAGMELQRVRELTDVLRREHAARIVPVQVEKRAPETSAADLWAHYQTVLAQGFLGEQYFWMAAVCRRLGAGDIELSIHRDDMATRLLTGWLEQDEYGRSRLGSGAPRELSELFSYYRFPLIGSSKQDMETQAIEWGMLDLLERSWFCHRPLLRKYPCGTCGPCVYTIQEGLGRRLSWVGRLRYLMRVEDRAKAVLRRWPALYAYLYKRKHR